MNDPQQVHSMSGKEEDVEREIIALLRETKHPLPMGFAKNAMLKYRQRVALRTLRRMIYLSVSLLVLASAALWILIFNFSNVAHSVWDGLTTAVSLIDSVMVFWKCVPVLSGVVTCILFGLSMLNFGVLAKLTGSRILVK
jgi:hypothetical protein